MPTINTDQLSPREKSIFNDGIRIINERLEAGRKAKAEHEAERSRRDAEIITKRLGSKLAVQCFGTPSITTSITPAKIHPAPKINLSQFRSVAYEAAKLAAREIVATSPRKKSADEETNPKTTKFFSISAGSGSPRSRIKKIYSGGGLFGAK